ncbi:MAG: hypothetical protein ABIK92_15170 [Pseudomonadota bacterium]
MTNLYKVFKYDFIIRVLIAMTIILSVYGCGRKGPPAAPRQLAVPAVNELKSLVEGDNVILEWTVPKTKEKKAPRITGFVIYQAKYPVAEDICENCPINYKPVAEVSADSAGKDGNIRYVRQLEKGFKYFFKVTAFSKNVTPESRDSNIIKIEY